MARIGQRLGKIADSLVSEGHVVGYSLGVWRDGESLFLSGGKLHRGSPEKPDADSIYEIGSITKVFTGALLSLAVEAGDVELSTPVEELIPGKVKLPRHDDRAITLLHLATHTSGLPRLPGDLDSPVPDDPYAHYDARRLVAFLKSHEPGRAPGQYEYSNLGAGLLGQALAWKARKSYGELLQRQILRPLGLRSTTLRLSSRLQKRLALPHGSGLERTRNWNFQSLAGAGALRSTARDQLRFLEAHFGEKPAGLGEALRKTLERHAEPGEGQAVGLGWHLARKGRLGVHAGRTGGYASYAGISLRDRIALILLTNTSSDAVAPTGEKLLLELLATSSAFPAEIPLPVSTLQTYCGVYEITPEFGLTITLEDGRLQARATGQAAFPLYPESKTLFFYRALDAKIRFLLDSSGEVTGLELIQDVGVQKARRRP